MSVDDAEFSAPWGWVPVLDFAVFLRDLALRLRNEHHGTYVFYFTESNHEITFHREGDRMEIRANYTAAVGQLEFATFAQDVLVFADRVKRDLERLYPSFASNDTARHLFERDFV